MSGDGKGERGDHFQIGDIVNMHGGTGNIGMVKNQNGPGLHDQQSALRDMVRAVHVLRTRVSPEDREVLDEALGTLDEGDRAEPGAVRRALTAIAGVAAVVGDIGVPVAEAVRRVLGFLGAV
ncbi:hypothetical protein [Streptomyces neyagawaensis]|uniref:Uncharacterized protein n=1 Tax=Streptomyces neyagawaensis TaxID=42238 RepID=A0ABV3B195_9ACTN